MLYLLHKLWLHLDLNLGRTQPRFLIRVGQPKLQPALVAFTLEVSL